MKMISSTSITSTSGVTLISLIGGLRLPRPPELTDIPIRRRSVPAHGPKGRETRRKRRGGAFPAARPRGAAGYSRSPQEWRRSEEHTSELQSLMRISYAVFCLKKKKKQIQKQTQLMGQQNETKKLNRTTNTLNTITY